MFDLIARINGWEASFGGWFKESNECIIVLYLQKSNYGNYYILNIKIFVQDVFNKRYVKSKELVNKETGTIFRALPKDYNVAINLENQIDDQSRKQMVESIFIDFINPFADKALTRIGIKQLEEEKQIFLLPAVENELKTNSIE